MSARNARRVAEKENAKASAIMERVPQQDWPFLQDKLIEVWRSRHFLAQIFAEPNSVQRISVCRVSRRMGEWEEGIAWDELMRVKREIGRGQQDAVEVYPGDRDIVNVANMRHLWLLPEPLYFAWRKP